MSRRLPAPRATWTRRNGARGGEPNGMATREPALSGGAAGGIVFAACVLTLVGVFQVIAGLTAIFDDEFFVVTRDYTFDLDTTAWGWLHLLIGLRWSSRDSACSGAAPGRWP